MDPSIHYATTSDGIGIAYWTLGDGPPLIVPPTLPSNHIELEWQIPGRRAAFEGMAQGMRVIRYDCRGMGMSQRDPIDFSVEAACRDLDAVVENLHLEHFAILRVPSSGDAPFAYAAAHSDHVTHLIIWEGQPVDDLDPGRQHQLEAIEPVMDRDWELYARIRSRVMSRWDGGNATLLEDIFRSTHTPASAKEMNKAVAEANPQPYLSGIKAPTLVLYHLGSRPREENARFLASRISGAHLTAVVAPSVGPYPNADAVDLIVRFVNPDYEHHAERVQEPSNGLRVILFTDLEKHTAMMQRLGDERGRAILREHEAITRDALAAYGGSEVKTMGDSFMASFGSATSALECAMAIQKAFAARNETADEQLRVRVGLSAGEPIAEDDDLFGSSVILAARIADQAQGGEIVLANVVRELASGKGFLFADRGEITLRGFEDPVRLYELRWDQAPSSSQRSFS
jgi:class 3 adenylate cyclase